MTANSMESYLNNIAEQVVDEDKIVTYKSLSRSLGIHVNTAKQLLYTYLTNEKSKNAFPISATYLVAGKVVDGSFNITIVNEADLKNAHLTFVEITSEHVYSVHKGKSLKDLKVLCGIKELSNSENSKLVITCSNGVAKSRGGEKKKPESREESNRKVITEALLPEKAKNAVPETNKKVETARNKESVSKSPKKTSPKGNIRKPAGNIANLFAKAAEKNARKTTTGEKLDRNTSEIVSKDNESVGMDVVEKIEPEKTERRYLENSSEPKENSKKRKKKGNKRKRIQMLSDSEESDSNDEEKIDNEEIENSPPETINIDEAEEKEEPREFIPRNKRKKRKLIDRTVMNEDGYLETKKEVVFETDSESEVEDVTTAPKVKPANDKGKGAPAPAGIPKKQSSLLTFFRKN